MSDNFLKIEYDETDLDAEASLLEISKRTNLTRLLRSLDVDISSAFEGLELPKRTDMRAWDLEGVSFRESILRNVRVTMLQAQKIRGTRPRVFDPHFDTRELADFETASRTIDERGPGGLYHNPTVDLSGLSITMLPENISNSDNLTSLILSNTKLGHFDGIEKLARLETLNLSGTPIKDFQRLRGMRGLRHLDLSNTAISDISDLPEMSSLSSLNLSGSGISSISGIELFSGLRELNLWNTPVSDIGPLSSLINLRVVNLRGTAVSDLSAFRRVTWIEELNLFESKVVDVSPLSKSIGLRRLNLGKTLVEDVSPLKMLRNLESLNLVGSLVVDVSSLRDQPELYVASDTVHSKPSSLNSLS